MELRLKWMLAAVVLVWAASVSVAAGASVVEGHAGDDGSGPRATVFPAEMGRGSVVPCISGSIAPVVFQFSGDAKALTEKTELVLDLPAGFTVYSKSGLLAATKQGSQRQLVRIDVSAEAGHMLPGPPKGSAAVVLVWLETDLAAGDSEVMRFHLAGGGKTHIQRQLRLWILPPFFAGPRARFMVGFFWSLFGDLPEVLYSNAYDLFRQGGINVFVTQPRAWEKLSRYHRYMEKRFKANGGQVWASVPGSSSLIL